jgi:hypothetical protein
VTVSGDEFELHFDDELAHVENGAQPLTVTTVAGFELPVLEPAEKTFYESIRDKYVGEYVMTDPSDIADLDAILTYELMVYRLSMQLGRGYDANRIPFAPRDISQLQKTLKEASEHLSKLKDALGVSKSARDKAAGEDVASYIRNLLTRAKEFGIHRNEQAMEAIVLAHEIGSVCGTYLRSNELERSKTDFRTADDVVAWIADTAYPRFQKVDEDFRANQQRMWIGEL